MAERTCSIPGCGRAYLAFDWCSMHYQRARATGDPLRTAAGRIGPEPTRLHGATTLDRFWHHVAVTDACWTWTASVNEHGYGIFNLRTNEGALLAHRFVWEITYGLIPSGRSVCHSCDNPPCIRPDHLFLGSHEDNMRDMATKRRGRGQRATHCKWGHEYTEDNTGWRHGTMRRYCRTCARRWASGWRSPDV